MSAALAAAAAALARGEELGARFRLAVPRSVPAGLAGLELGRHAGASLEFKEHRDYEPGDDPRWIDWSAYARSDRLTVKLYREEVSPHLDLLIDGSRSMALRGTAKAEAVLGLAAVLASACENAGYTHAVWTSASHWEPLEAGAERPSAWGDVAFTSAATPAEALAAAPPRLGWRSVRVLLSDLLWLGDPEAVLEPMAQGAAAVHVVQVLAEEDVEPAVRGNARLVDCEDGQWCDVFAGAEAAARYRENLARHQESWSEAARRVGATLATVVAERFVKAWDLALLVEAGVVTV